MKPYKRKEVLAEGVTLYLGNCRKVLKALPANSVHCCITSPPYWGLRDYGIPPTVWGGDPACKHEWGEPQKPGNYNWGEYIVADGHQKKANAQRSAFCRHCGAWRGTHGLEPTIDLYVRNAVEIFREVHRVLRPDGTLWLNLGDSYAAARAGHSFTPQEMAPNARGEKAYGGFRTAKTSGRGGSRDALAIGLKHKDLCGIPWRVAFALQADGWYLRQDIIWAKPNPMPESVTDRCTKAHEYLFLLTKSPRYFYDAEAIKETLVGEPHAPGNLKLDASRNDHDQMQKVWGANGTRNKRSVWTVATAPFSEAHFATFPPALIEPCIKAGCPENGTILDPFVGSGTTGIISVKFGRKFIGIDLSPKYLDMAGKRIYKKITEPNLIDKKPKPTEKANKKYGFFS